MKVWLRDVNYPYVHVSILWPRPISSVVTATNSAHLSLHMHGTDTKVEDLHLKSVYKAFNYIDACYENTIMGYK